MPLGRYFAVTGSVLLALLLLIDWYVPPSATGPGEAAFDRPIIRIQSKQRWPSPIVFDTAQPAIVPPPSLVTAAAPAPPAASPREAFAYAPQPFPAAATAPAPPKPAVRRTKVARVPADGLTSSDTGFREVLPAGW